MTTKDKIIDYLKVRGITKNKFYTETGLSNGFLDSGKSLSVDNLKIIVSKYPDINLRYLISDDDIKMDELIMNEPVEKYTRVCHECNEKQKEIERLHNTIEHLLDESKKDRELIRNLALKNEQPINKQQNSA